MTIRFIRLATLAAAAVLSLGAAKPAPAPRGNWLTAVTVTPRGTHLLGNPAAKVKLVEYVSYTCSHCAHFQKQSEVAMRLAYIQPGKVQVEVRHLIRDPIDMTVAMLTNCGAPTRFFGNHNLFLSNQDKWIGRMSSATPSQRARWTTGDNAARMRAIAQDYGFYAMMEARGYDRPTINRCLGDAAMAVRIAGQAVEAERLGINYTPAFLIDGVLLAGTSDWQSLNTQLEARF